MCIRSFLKSMSNWFSLWKLLPGTISSFQISTTSALQGITLLYNYIGMFPVLSVNNIRSPCNEISYDFSLFLSNSLNFFKILNGITEVASPVSIITLAFLSLIFSQLDNTSYLLLLVILRLYIYSFFSFLILNDSIISSLKVYSSIKLSSC